MYCAEENITIAGEGDYVKDMLLFPALGEDEKLFEEPNLTMSEELGKRTTAPRIRCHNRSSRNRDHNRMALQIQSKGTQVRADSS